MALFLGVLAFLFLGNPESVWIPVAEGVDYGRFQLGAGDSVAHVVRVDPHRAEVRVRSSAPGEEPLAMPEWGKKHDLVFATNAGMFGEDRQTHIGYFKVEGRELTPRIHPKYQSAFLLHPLDAGHPPFRIIDIDEQDIGILKNQYATVVQNLRLIKAPGENRWPENTRKWSEMALGQDVSGRMVFIFTRTPFTMHAWNEAILELPLGLVAVQHLEGGREAQFFVRLPGKDLFQVGGWLGGVGASLGGIPNIIGISATK